MINNIETNPYYHKIKIPTSQCDLEFVNCWQHKIIKAKNIINPLNKKEKITYLFTQQINKFSDYLVEDLPLPEMVLDKNILRLQLVLNKNFKVKQNIKDYDSNKNVWELQNITPVEKEDIIVRMFHEKINEVKKLTIRFYKIINIDKHLYQSVMPITNFHFNNLKTTKIQFNTFYEDDIAIILENCIDFLRYFNNKSKAQLDLTTMGINQQKIK